MRFETRCHFYSWTQRGGYAIKTPSFDVDERGTGRSHQLFCGLVSCSSIVVLTTSLSCIVSLLLQAADHLTLDAPFRRIEAFKNSLETIYEILGGLFQGISYSVLSYLVKCQSKTRNTYICNGLELEVLQSIKMILRNKLKKKLALRERSE